MCVVCLLQETKAPSRLLVIEAFAGSHPVGRHFQNLHAQQHPAPYSLAAYAAIEAEKGSECATPAPETLGLTPAHHLSLRPAGVEDDSTRAQLISFVHEQLQESSLDGVVVFARPPCKVYTNANSRVRARNTQRQQALVDAEAACDHAQMQLDELMQSEEADMSVAALRSAVSAAASRLADAEAARKAAANAVEQGDLELHAADAVVINFLSLFQDVQQACQADGIVPCHLVMENSYSTADRALWNR
jgi:hypothetical protein